MKHYSNPQFMSGLSNSSVVLLASMLNLVKVVLEQLLFQETLTLCVKWWDRPAYDIPWDRDILGHWQKPNKNYFGWALSSEEELQSLDSAQLDREIGVKKCSKIRSRCFYKRIQYRNRWRNLDICVWAQNKATIDNFNAFLIPNDKLLRIARMFAHLLLKYGLVQIETY